MSPDAYRKRLASLDLTQEQADELFGASSRTGQRWAAVRRTGPSPKRVGTLLAGRSKAKAAPLWRPAPTLRRRPARAPRYLCLGPFTICAGRLQPACSIWASASKPPRRF
jgi:hypothetical protein